MGKEKTVDFSETIAASHSDLKISRSRNLNYKYNMKVCEY